MHCHFGVILCHDRVLTCFQISRLSINLKGYENILLFFECFVNLSVDRILEEYSHLLVSILRFDP